jgi:kynurenine 3-monooxygenase
MENLVIVGAGLVGSLLSIYLARLGYKVRVYERRMDPRKTEATPYRSINITLCRRGLCALERVGISEAATNIAVPALGRVIHDPLSKTTYQPYSNRGEAILSVSRHRLNQLLLDHAGVYGNIELHFNEECVGLDLQSNKLRFQNRMSGSQSTCSFTRVFGADGAFSRLRDHCQRRTRFNYSQCYSIQAYKELVMPATASGEWPLSAGALHIWPRGSYMLIAFPNTDRSFTCSLHLPYEGDPSFGSVRSEQDLLALFQHSFPDACALMPSLVQDYAAGSPNAMITVRCFPWVIDNRVVLIGDAAHSIYPSYGQGANAGFEDCLILSQCIEQHGHAWDQALAEYQTLRKPNADAIAELSELHFQELRDSVGDPHFLLRKEVERRFNSLYPGKFADLYSMISFTLLSYVDAVHISRKQEALVQQVMSVQHCCEKLRSGEIDDVIHQVMRRADTEEFFFSSTKPGGGAAPEDKQDLSTCVSGAE